MSKDSSLKVWISYGGATSLREANGVQLFKTSKTEHNIHINPTIFCQKKCEKLLQCKSFSHVFSEKIKHTMDFNCSGKINNSLINDFVKLKML